MHFWCAKFLARKNGRVNFLTNLKSAKRICYSKVDRTLIIVMVVTVAMKILATTVMVMMKMSRKKRGGLEWFE